MSEETNNKGLQLSEKTVTTVYSFSILKMYLPFDGIGYDASVDITFVNDQFGTAELHLDGSITERAMWIVKSVIAAKIKEIEKEIVSDGEAEGN